MSAMRPHADLAESARPATHRRLAGDPGANGRKTLVEKDSAGTSAARAARRRKKRWLRRLVFLILLVGASAGAVWHFLPMTASPKQHAASPTETVARRDFASSVLATGVVQPQIGAEVRVGARISGKVERLLANIGDRVEKGQVVAQLEQADLEAVVTQREAELQLANAKLAAVESLLPQQTEKAKADVLRSRASLAKTEKDRNRAAKLRPTQAVSETDYDATVANHEMDKAQLTSAEKAYDLAKTEYVEQRRQAKAEIARAASALANAKVQLSYATITAPIDGVIASVSTEQGETVAAGMQAPTFVTIIDLDRLQVDAFVDEVDIGKVAVGQRAVFTVDAFPATEFAGKVSAIYPKAVIQDNVVNYDVVVDIETPYHGLLRPEMTASVTILLDERPGVLAIPAKAVQRQRGKTMVHVVADGKAEPRDIKVGWRDGPWIEIASGLAEGETILLEAPATNSQ
ncbi:MAG: efflux RND transporter periplasmic adaptor subunit [Pirellulaceae bacterium]|nr:efflux RND transporter periplasmic adaptor subunit [Pirellulaceae bacterium]